MQITSNNLHVHALLVTNPAAALNTECSRSIRCFELPVSVA